MKFFQRRSILWLALVVLLAFGAVLWIVRMERRIGEAQFQRIEKGMTEQHVAAMFGRPGRTRESFVEFPGIHSPVVFPEDPRFGYERYWRDDDFFVSVDFNADGRVTSKMMASSRPPPPHWIRDITLLLRRCGLPI